MSEADSSIASQPARLKYGFVREDGKIFVNYRAKGPPYWVSPQKFEELRQKGRDRRKNRTPEQKKILAKKCKEWRAKNPEKNAELKKAWRAANRGKELLYAKSWRQNNPDKVAQHERTKYLRHKESILAKNRVYRQKNKDVISAQKREYIARRRRGFSQYAIQMRVRARFANAMNRKGWSKDAPMQAIVGCSWEELKSHLESRFLPGMTWENRSEWHIDHIIPCSTASTEEEMKKLFHFSNLQPLWKEDNLKKGAKLLNTSPDAPESTGTAHRRHHQIPLSSSPPVAHLSLVMPQKAPYWPSLAPPSLSSWS